MAKDYQRLLARTWVKEMLRIRRPEPEAVSWHLIDGVIQRSPRLDAQEVFLYQLRRALNRDVKPWKDES